VKGPFFWRHLWILLGVGLNFALAVFLVGRAQRGFGRFPLAVGLVLRASSFVWLTLSLVALLLAISLFHALELEGEANWRANREWKRVQAGTTKREVIAMLGAPESHIGVRYGYHLSPLHDQEATIYFEGDPNAAELEDKLADDAKVVRKEPEEARGEWMPPYFVTVHVRDHVKGDVLPMATGGVLTLLVLSLIPFSLRGGWNSWVLYLPVTTLVFGVLYEASVEGGWRFDLFLFVPAYLVIAVAWLLRVWVVRRRARTAGGPAGPS
jgi:hypothetical protein